MPLLDLTTNLKSLKYGQDRPGGGSSGQPYMQFPLPENASEDVREYYENNKYNLDFPIRGGGYNIGADGPYVGQAAKYDRQRIEKFLKDAPRGPVFILKQQALQLSNPKIQVGSQINLDLGVLPFRFLGALENTRIYNGGKNTLQQVGVQGSGIHFDRHGNIPVNPYEQTYAYVADDRIAGNPDKNRLNVLYQTKILKSSKIPLTLDNSDLVTTLNDLGISRDSGLILQYPGGPNSAGGFGFTTVQRRYESQLFSQNPKTQADYFKLEGNNYTTAYKISKSPKDIDPLSYQGTLLGLAVPAQEANSVATGIVTLDTGLRDTSNTTADSKGAPIATERLKYLYEKLLINDPEAQIVYSYDGGPGGTETVLNRYSSTNTATDSTQQNSLAGDKVGTPNIRNFNYTYNYRQLSEARSNQEKGAGNTLQDFRLALDRGGVTVPSGYTQGYEDTGRNNIVVKYGIGTPGTKDLDRSDYRNTGNGQTQDQVNMLDVGEAPANVKDLITFKFETIEITGKPIPLVFRAFLTSFQDNHTAEYSPFRYVGRGENFYTYNGFTRQISFNFKIAAQSRSEMKPLYRKLNTLLSQLYPDYKAGTGFMRAPLIKLTVGDYVSIQPGFLTSMNVTVGDDSPWEIANNQIEGADAGMYELPHVLEVSCQFTPIHDFLPRRSVAIGNDYYITPLITPNTPGSNKFEVGNLNLLLAEKVARAIAGRR